MIRDRLSWMRFLGFDLGAPMPDENTIRHFGNRLTHSGVLAEIKAQFEGQLIPAAIINDSYVRWYKGRDCGPRSDPEIGGNAPRGISEGEAKREAFLP